MSMIIPTDLSFLSVQQKEYLLANYQNCITSSSAIFNYNRTSNNTLCMALGIVYNSNTGYIQSCTQYTEITENGTVTKYSSSNDWDIANNRIVYSLMFNGVIVDINNTSGGEIHFPPSNNISLEDNPLIKELQDDVSLIANFEKKPNRKKYIIAS